MTPEEQLLDYRRSVADMYRRVRESDAPLAECWQRFRKERDNLFCTHPQSALSADQQAVFAGLPYFSYDPALRFILRVEPEPEPTLVEMHLEHDGNLKLRRFGRVHFSVGGQAVSLVVYWILAYGGGIFIPFGDRTNGHETYGGGRYILDTIKHVDLGHEDGGLVIDFNFAYNPSCAYNPRWFCPLAPRENRLPVAIRAGELTYPDAHHF